MSLTIFVGYDAREELAWQVLRFSIQRRASGPVQVIPLKHRELREGGLFTRTWRVDEAGQCWDDRDGKPFSTEFSHSRFLIQALSERLGVHGRVVFCDIDFVFLTDPYKLLEEAPRDAAVSCVKHDWDSARDGKKMDGVLQEGYGRKLWSSLMVWNVDHPSNKLLTPHRVNYSAGSWLHALMWLQDEEIGALPPHWNWIPYHSPDDLKPAAVHFSFGGPWMRGYEGAPYADVWRREYHKMLCVMAADGSALDPEYLTA